jgi:hypothetical protein
VLGILNALANEGKREQSKIRDAGDTGQMRQKEKPPMSPKSGLPGCMDGIVQY